jgi:homoserine O-succinyltransferase
MPICLDRGGKSPIDFRPPDPNCVDIGLINNMPDSALEATERQFLALLDAAAEGIVVRLSLYSLPDVPRTDTGRRYLSRCYAGIEELWNRQLDGLIVTGTEPQAANLMHEPYWGSLTRVLEWADHSTHSTVWSCLAAHAAVLHFDGIGRQALPDKRFGLFEYARVADHDLTAGVPFRMQMPHSRWNDVSEDALTSCGYRVLTQSEDASVDMFARKRNSLFVFFQGHPEYEAQSLLLEYRRDIGRFLRRERKTYPPIPRSYFDDDTVELLTSLRTRALSDRREGLLADFPTALLAGKVSNTWRPAAARIYRNWLSYICAQKDRSLKTSHSRQPLKRVEAV